MLHFAYLDPGSGSLLLQVLLGGFAAAAVGLRVFGRRLKALNPFRRDRDEHDPDQP